jgi:hypothetical protein
MFIGNNDSILVKWSIAYQGQASAGNIKWFFRDFSGRVAEA